VSARRGSSSGTDARRPSASSRSSRRADFPAYFIDDQTAIRVDGSEIDVVSEGRWRFHP
jgi:hypothetical protein